MDEVKSFKGYGKIDELQQHEFLKKTSTRFLMLAFLALVLVGILAAVIAAVVHVSRNGRDDDGANSTPSPELTPALSLIAVCGVTRYPDSCFSSISALNVENSTDPQQLFLLSLMVAADELRKVAGLPSRLAAKSGGTRIKDGVRAALLNVCLPLLQDAADTITESMGALNSTGQVGKLVLNSSGIGELRTQLSAALTDQETCIDSLTEFNATTLANSVRSATRNATQFTSNSLAIATRIISLLVQLNFPTHRRRLLRAGNGGDGIQKNCSKFQWDQSKKLTTPRPRNCDGGRLPAWVGLRERRMLAGEVTPDVTVATDGSGDFKTISEAVTAVPVKNATGRFVIYVKAGKYTENVNIGKNMWNVMMYGDGNTQTVVSGGLNFVDGTPTFLTATFVVTGKGFIARDVGFENTAGAAKAQAVALRSASDFSVFYRCSFDGFQGTLYAYSNRQFYRECDITGTIDFIFGNSAAIFQDCNILPRQPMDNQFNTITAQGKTDVDQNTGISIEKCTISANGYVTAPTYLGRPWKNCSTTVVMQSNIDSILNPKGWIAWVYGVDPPKTIFYGEYQNMGAGADTSQRITWAGYEAAMSDAEAEKFTVNPFIQGLDWLPQTSVTYDSSL